MTQKRVLVTGAEGFIGRRVVSTLKSSGHNVQEFTITDGDIVTYELEKYEADHIIHLAAMVYVPLSWEKPYEFYRVNVMGTENVLEYCRKKGASLTFPSTYVYGTPKYLPIDENHPINPNTPYNHSKVMAESLCEFYHKAFGINVTVLRPFNIYGAGQSEQFLIPSIVKQYKDDTVKEITVMDLAPKRDYVYVDDVVKAIVSTIGQKGYNIYNVAGGVSYSVEDIIRLVCKTGGKDKRYISKNVERRGEVSDIVADISKIKNKLGWSPKINMEEGLKNMMQEAFK